jgi:hypothetical protein
MDYRVSILDRHALRCPWMVEPAAQLISLPCMTKIGAFMTTCDDGELPDRIPPLFQRPCSGTTNVSEELTGLKPKTMRTRRQL